MSKNSTSNKIRNQIIDEFIEESRKWVATHYHYPKDSDSSYEKAINNAKDIAYNEMHDGIKQIAKKLKV